MSLEKNIKTTVRFRISKMSSQKTNSPSLKKEDPFYEEFKKRHKSGLNDSDDWLSFVQDEGDDDYDRRVYDYQQERLSTAEIRTKLNLEPSELKRSSDRSLVTAYSLASSALSKHITHITSSIPSNTAKMLPSLSFETGRMNVLAIDWISSQQYGSEVSFKNKFAPSEWQVAIAKTRFCPRIKVAARRRGRRRRRDRIRRRLLQDQISRRASVDFGQTHTKMLRHFSFVLGIFIMLLHAHRFLYLAKTETKNTEKGDDYFMTKILTIFRLTNFFSTK